MSDSRIHFDITATDTASDQLAELTLTVKQ